MGCPTVVFKFPPELAEQVLVAVAEGDPRSLELAARLCELIVADEITVKATEALKLLAAGSPFALVRVVELAERVLAPTRMASVGRSME